MSRVKAFRKQRGRNEVRMFLQSST